MPKRTNPQPGEIWWCDGATLAFEAYFKTRPVLVIAAEGGSFHVMLLSSRRRFGQEIAVAHERGVSFMTGQIQSVPASALFRKMGVWDGFANWQENKRLLAEEMRERAARPAWWKRLLDWLQGFFKNA